MIALEAAQKRIADSILSLLQNPGDFTEARIMVYVRGRRQTKVRVLRSLINQEMITRSGSGVKLDPYRYRIKVAGNNNVAHSELVKKSTEVLL